MAKFCAVAQVAQIASTTCAPLMRRIQIIISLTLVVLIVPLTGKTELVPQVLAGSCSTTKYCV